MAQPKYHILKAYANGVMDQEGKFYPFKSQSWVASGSLPVYQNRRYYIKDIEINHQGLLSTGPLVDKVEATVGRITSIIAQLTTPIVIAAVSSLVDNQRFDVGLLTDLNTAVTITIAAASPMVIIQYAEIDESPGVYQG